MSKLSRREREKLKRRNDILDAAEKKFFEKGYDQISMDDIADDVELSKATLYLYFKNKASLYFAVVIKGMKILRDTFNKAVEKEVTGLRKIIAIIEAYYDYIQLHANYYRLNVSSRSPRFTKMLEESEEESNMIEDVETYINLTKELLEILTNAVSLGIKDGTVRKDLNPIQTVMFLGAAIEATVQISPEYHLLLEMYAIKEETYLKHSIDLILHGIAGEKA